MASVSLPLLPFVDIANFPLPCVSPGEFPGLAVSEATPVVITSKPLLPLGGGSTSRSSARHLPSLSSPTKHPIPPNPKRRRYPSTAQPRSQIRHHLPSDPSIAESYSRTTRSVPQIIQLTRLLYVRKCEARREIYSRTRTLSLPYIPGVATGPPGTPPRPSQSAQARSTKFTSIIKCL